VPCVSFRRAWSLDRSGHGMVGSRLSLARARPLLMECRGRNFLLKLASHEDKMTGAAPILNVYRRQPVLLSRGVLRRDRRKGGREETRTERRDKA
jgi:hypothetical protein